MLFLSQINLVYLICFTYGEYSWLKSRFFYSFWTTYKYKVYYAKLDVLFLHCCMIYWAQWEYQFENCPFFILGFNTLEAYISSCLKVKYKYGFALLKCKSIFWWQRQSFLSVKKFQIRQSFNNIWPWQKWTNDFWGSVPLF